MYGDIAKVSKSIRCKENPEKEHLIEEILKYDKEIDKNDMDQMSVYELKELLNNIKDQTLKESTDYNFISTSPLKGLGRDAVELAKIPEDQIKNVIVILINDFDPTNVIIELNDGTALAVNLNKKTVKKEKSKYHAAADLTGEDLENIWM